MTKTADALYVRGVVKISLGLAAVATVAAVVVEGKFSTAAAGVLIGSAASLLILALRIKSVRSVLDSPTTGGAGRSAFLLSLAKLGVAFAALAAGAALGRMAVAWVLGGLFVTHIATVAAGVRQALAGSR